LENWKCITDDEIILGIIQGYKIPFISHPKQLIPLKNPEFSSIEEIIMIKKIDSLMKLGAIEKCCPSEAAFVSPIFLVKKPNGDYRFILNLKSLNRFVDTPHFQMEDYRTVKLLMWPKCYFASIDLQDAYYVVPVKEEDRKFLCFQWNNTMYRFTCLPFGLSTSPLVFTKILRPFVGFLRSRGIFCCIYLDDLLCLDNTKQSCSDNVSFILANLQALGFVINFDKSQLVPCQKIKYLGFIFDSMRFCVTLTDSKRESIMKTCSNHIIKGYVRIRDFAQLLGTLIAACPAVPYGYLHTKVFEIEKLNRLKIKCNNFEEKIKMTDSIKLELEWWIKTLPCAYSPVRFDTFEFEIYSDASMTGWGLSCNDVNSHGFWSPEESTHSINYLELMAAYHGLRCFARDKTNCQILLRIDNTTAISYINRMGGVRYCKYNKLARAIWDFCEKRRIWLFASYISSAENYEADFESRRSDFHSEWELSDEAFLSLTNRFGKPITDLFATYVNRKCKQFCSWRPDPLAWRIDAFTVDWSKLTFYAFPPFSMILRCLQKINHGGGEGIVVVPYWPSQSWWPLFKRLCKDNIVFNANSDLLSFNNRLHPLNKTLTLVGGFLSSEH